MRIAFSAFAILFLTATAAPAADETLDEQIARLTASMPRDVADFAPRLAGCTHWGGEYGGEDKERTRQINDAMAKLGCDHIKADYMALGKRHAAEPAVIDRLNHIMAELGGAD